MNDPNASSFGRYRVRERLGAGAMGEVFVAHDDRLGRDVAIKSIRVHGLSTLQRTVFEQRFEHEARALAALSHPHIVPVFDMGIEGEVPYLVMEHLAGKPLSARVEAHTYLSPAEARAVGVQISSALAAAHGRDILHRDIKPANILEAEPGVWKLADFGIAHVPDSSLTLTGQFLGSPAYAAPEALGEGELGPASDVYALGATLYEVLTGQLPFGPRGLLSPAALVDERPAQPITDHRGDLPPGLAAAIMRCLDRDPRARPSTAELGALLAEEREPRAASAVVPVGPRPPAWRLPVLLGGGVLLVAILIGVAASGGDGGKGPSPSAAPSMGSPPGSMVPEQRSEDADKKWRKAQEKLSRGDLRGAEKELSKLVRKSPEDLEAQQLLDDVRTQLELEPEQGHGRGRGKKH